MQARRDFNRRLRRLRGGDDETAFLRREGETYEFVKTNLQEIYGDENVLDLYTLDAHHKLRGITLTDRPEFDHLQWGDILYAEDRDTREQAYHAIVFNGEGERVALSISGSTGSGVEIPTTITSRIENPMTFYDELHRNRWHEFEDLFVLLDSRIHYDAMYNWSGLPNLALRNFFWNGDGLLMMNPGEALDTEGKDIDEYGNIYVYPSPPAPEASRGWSGPDLVKGVAAPPTQSGGGGGGAGDPPGGERY